MSTPPLASSAADGPPTPEQTAPERATAAFTQSPAPAAAPPVAAPEPPVFDARRPVAPLSASNAPHPPGPATGPFGPGDPAPVVPAFGGAAATPSSPVGGAPTAVVPVPAPETFTPSTFGSGTRPSPAAETRGGPEADDAPTGRRPSPRVLVLGALGVLAATSVGLLLLTGGGDEEAAFAPVVSAASAAPTTAPADADPTDPDAVPAVAGTRNVFVPLVTPAAVDDGSDASASASLGAATGLPAGTGLTAVAPVVVTAPVGTTPNLKTQDPSPTSTTSTPTSTPSAPATAAPTALTVLWTGTTSVGDAVAQTVALTTSAGTTAVAVVPGAALGTAAPLSWITSQGVGADGVLTLVAGTTRYQLTSGVPLALF